MVLASSRKTLSRAIAMNALRNASTRSSGTSGGATNGMPVADGAVMMRASGFAGADTRSSRTGRSADPAQGLEQAHHLLVDEVGPAREACEVGEDGVRFALLDRIHDRGGALISGDDLDRIALGGQELRRRGRDGVGRQRAEHDS